MSVKNQIGTIVLFLLPNPNCLKPPSLSYKNAGSTNCTTANTTTKNMWTTTGTNTIMNAKLQNKIKNMMAANLVKPRSLDPSGEVC